MSFWCYVLRIAAIVPTKSCAQIIKHTLQTTHYSILNTNILKQNSAASVVCSLKAAYVKQNRFPIIFSILYYYDIEGKKEENNCYWKKLLQDKML